MFRKIGNKIVILAAAINLIILSACSSVSNLTPQKVAQSESGSYTLTMSASVKDSTLVRGSEKAYVVIDGERHLMKPVLNLKNEIMYQYDYTLPRGKTFAEYYYVLDYKACSSNNRVISYRSIKGDEVFALRPLTRVINALATDIAPIGATVAVKGQGFNAADVIIFDGKALETNCASRSSLEFTVPIVDASKRYDVEIKHADGSMSWAGGFVVKPSNLTVSPSSISKESGQVVNIIFDLGVKAPKGGYYIDVQTNIPSSVIMPEIIVAEGESSVAVPVKFAAAGKGALYINAVGFKEKIIPVNVEAIVPVEFEVNTQGEEIQENVLMTPQAPVEDEVILIEPKE
ncbi:MAG: hypothetical protein R3Y46_06720 [Opitutales bacterium]